MGRLLFVLLTMLGWSAASAAETGYFRYKVGDFSVIALKDGSVDLGLGAYQGLPPDEMRRLAERSGTLKETGIETAVTAYLVDTGSERILVDAGNANCYGWKMGGLVGNLQAAGYRPEQIDVVVLTHLHGDHVCGLVRNGQRVFPTAKVYAAADEAAYWLDEKTAKAQPENSRIGFIQARETLVVYGKDFHTFHAGDHIASGMTIVPTPGHTPGHTAFLFQSKGSALIAWGDIVHCTPVQFPHPEVSVISDYNRAEAVATREALFARLSEEGTAIAGAHLPFPGIGHLGKDGSSYRWMPVAP